MIIYSGFFNQVILYCMIGVDCIDGICQKVVVFYEQYFVYLVVFFYIYNGFFGNYDGSLDWIICVVDNFLLFFFQDLDMVMMFFINMLLIMLNFIFDIVWDNFYLL